MKIAKYNILVVLLLLIFSTSFLNCLNTRTFGYFYHNRIPSSRAEAMGRGYVAVDGDLESYHFNPAGIQAIDRVEVRFSNTDSSTYWDDADFKFYGFGYNWKDFITIGFNATKSNFKGGYGGMT